MINLFAKAADAPQAALRLDSGLTDPATTLVRTRPEAVPAGQAGGEDGARASSASRPRILTYVNYPTRFDSTETQAALAGTGIEVPPLETYADRVWDYWERNLDPDLFKDRSLVGGGARQGGADHRRLLGDRQGDRGQGRRRRRDGAAGRPLGREARGDQSGDRGGGRRRPHPPLRHGRHRGRRADGRGGARLPRPGRHPGQQRRALDPPLGRPRLRPLPRLRADDAAQLLRRGAADPGAAALDAGAQVGPHHQHQLDRRRRPTRRASPPTSPRRRRSTPSAA